MTPAGTARVEAARARGAGLLARTRASLLSATEELVARQGVRRTSMAQLAGEAGVAKATLYNHFRDKDDVLSALLLERARALAEDCAATARADGLRPALEQAAAALASSPALRRVAVEEPERLLPLLAGPAAARPLAARVLQAAGADDGPEAVELVLRWLLSGLLWPTPPSLLVTAALAGAGPVPTAQVPAQASPAGLGWPG